MKKYAFTIENSPTKHRNGQQNKSLLKPENLKSLDNMNQYADNYTFKNFDDPTYKMNGQHYSAIDKYGKNHIKDNMMNVIFAKSRMMRRDAEEVRAA